MRWPWARLLPDAGDADFRYAIVGTGHGAEKFARALRASTRVAAVAVISSSQARGEAFARRHGLALALTPDKLADAAAQLDAVYIAVPNTLHGMACERAAAAGLHVLCEKPLAATATAAEAMVDTCRAAGVRLGVGYRFLYDPAFLGLRERLQAGELGAVRHVETGFGFVAKPGWRLDPALAGGGSLLDVGIYGVAALRTLFGETQLTGAQLERDPRTGMEVEARWAGTLPGGATFSARSSYIERVPDHLRVVCARGTLQLAPVFSYSGNRLELLGDGRTQRIALPGEVSGFRLEAEAFAVASLAACETATRNAIADLRVIEGIEVLARGSAAP